MSECWERFLGTVRVFVGVLRGNLCFFSQRGMNHPERRDF